jgi:hypothetical protein
MIEQSKDGGPAFPCDPQMMRVSEDGSIEAIGFRGMSLRDWFAGQSLAGINASRETFLAILKDRGRNARGSFHPSRCRSLTWHIRRQPKRK